MSEQEIIIKLDDFPDDGIFEIMQDSYAAGASFLQNESLLLVISQGRYHVIENKCGHFGVPLLNAELHENEIICAEHGISFDLDSGEIINRPYENCDPIKVFASTVINIRLYLHYC